MKGPSMKRLKHMTFTTMVCLPMVTPLFSYGIDDLVLNKERFSVDIQEEGGNDLINEQSLSEEFLNENKDMRATQDVFVLSDWSYTEYKDYIELWRYNGSQIDIYIPGEYQGKQIVLRTLKIFPENMVDLKIEAINGKKAKVSTAWLSYSFKGNKTIRRIDLRGLDTSNATVMDEMFAQTKLAWLDLRGLDTSNVTSMRRMFYQAGDISQLDLSSFDTSKVTDMKEMFDDLSELTELDISSFNTSNVTDMSSMFAYVSSLKSLDLSHFDTSKVEKMNSMFYGMTSLTDLNISSFDTANVTTMKKMFEYLKSLKTLDISSFNTSKVVDMAYMFNEMRSLISLDLSHFDTSNVTNMTKMFSNMSQLRSLDLSSFKFYPQIKTDRILECEDCIANLVVVTEDEHYLLPLKEAASRPFQIVQYPLISYQTQLLSGKGIPGASIGLFSKNGSRIAYGSVDKNGNYQLKIPKQPINSTINLKLAQTGYEDVWIELRVLDVLQAFTWTTPTVSSTSISGKGVASAMISVSDSQGYPLGTTTVDSKGNYKVSIPKQKSGMLLTIKQEKRGYAPLNKQATVLNEFKTFTVPTIATNTTAIYGTGVPGATVRAYVNGKAISDKFIVNTKGNYKLTIPKQKVGAVIEVKQAKAGYLTVSKKMTVLNTITTFTYNTPTISTTQINGKALVGSKVGVYNSNGTRLALVNTDSKGNYKLTIPKQKAGTVLTMKQAKTGYVTLSKNVTVLNEIKTFTYSAVRSTSTTVSGKALVGSKVGIYTSTGKRLAIVNTDSKGNYKLIIPKQKVGAKLILKQAKTGYATASKNITVVK